MPKPSTGLKTRQALNLIILLCSAMFLIFTLLSKKIQVPEDGVAFKIVKIDFGERQLIWRDGNWLEASLSDSVSPLSKEDLNFIGDAWQAILDSAWTDSKKPSPAEALSGPTVLLYLDGRADPMVAKLVVYQGVRFAFFPVDNRLVNLAELEFSIGQRSLRLTVASDNGS